MRVYEGIRNPSEPNSGGETIVLVNGQVLPLAPSQKLFNHSPDGYNWGYSGSGPAQLSLALLLDALGNKERALRLHQSFKSRVVAAWPQDQDWMITQKEIRDICRELEK